MDFSRRCPRFHHANSRPTLSRLQRARRKNLYLSLEYTTFCLKKQVKKTISMKVQNFVTFPVHSRFKFGADVPLLPNGDIAHACRSDAPARMGVSLIEKQRLFPDGKRQKASSLRRTVQRQRQNHNQFTLYQPRELCDIIRRKNSGKEDEKRGNRCNAQRIP